MQPDQAAGLRRRRAEQPLRCIYCFLDSADLLFQLAQTLHQRGDTVLLVDARGRLLGDTPMRNLFDWKHQLERGQLHTSPLAHGKGWHAPGVTADEHALRHAAHDYDHVVFDLALTGGELVLMPDVVQTVIMDVHSTPESKLRAYTLIKTLANDCARFSVGLLGDLDACGHVRAACCHFLDQRLAQAIYLVAQEGDAFAALAGRMAAEERA